MEYRLAGGKEPWPVRESPRPGDSPGGGTRQGAAVNCMLAARANGSAAFAVMTSTRCGGHTGCTVGYRVGWVPGALGMRPFLLNGGRMAASRQLSCAPG